jgi:hypothetical protein
MNTLTKLSLIFVAAVLLLLGSCRKLEEYPLEPQIEFHDFVLLLNQLTGITEKGILMVSYQDGDGDIGLDQGDTLFPFHPQGDYYYNLVITYFERQYGEFVEVPLLSWNSITQQYDTNSFSTRIPPLIPKDQEKAIKGIIEYEMFIYNPLSDFDTIQFKVKLIDRALNISNEVTTPPIVRITP